MLFIQFLIIAFALFVISRIILTFKRGKISPKSLLFWLGLWLTIPVVFLLPQTTSYIAEILGFWRGADVAVYFSIILIFYLIFRIFVKFEKIDSNITTITREIALQDKNNKKNI